MSGRLAGKAVDLRRYHRHGTGDAELFAEMACVIAARPGR